MMLCCFFKYGPINNGRFKMNQLLIIWSQQTLAKGRLKAMSYGSKFHLRCPLDSSLTVWFLPLYVLDTLFRSSDLFVEGNDQILTTRTLMLAPLTQTLIFGMNLTILEVANRKECHRSCCVDHQNRKGNDPTHQCFSVMRLTGTETVILSYTTANCVNKNSQFISY